MNCYMGIDIGTYESKGVITDENANVLAYSARPHKMEVPQPGYAEHDAETIWWADFCAISNTLIKEAGIDPAEIKGVGTSTIAPCCLPVDEELRPLRKAILYGVDCRSRKEIEDIEKEWGKDRILEQCGSPLTSQSAAAKILWVRRNEPEIYEKAAHFVTGATYLVAKLTGEYVIDHYTAATWVPIYDVRTLDWTRDPGEFCRREQLAECRWTHKIAGYVTEKAAAETGLAPGTPVTTGTADASAEAVSTGVMNPGDLMVMYGSSIFMIHVVPHLTRNPVFWSSPYLFPGTYSAAAGINCAGTLTRWFLENYAKDLADSCEANGTNVFAAMMDRAKDIPAGSDGLIVLPYFSGERTPINDPLAKGVIFGLDLRHTRWHIYKAILEGTGYAISQVIDLMGHAGCETKKIMAVGGGTRNPLWIQAVSDICGREQHITKVKAGASYGDALLAALATGRYASPEEMAKELHLESTVSPVSYNAEIYSSAKQRYANIYKNTKEIMHSF